MICPLLSAVRKQECIEARCKFWTHLYGKDPQSHQTVDKFGCAIEYLPILLVENAQMIRQAAASTDKVANGVAISNAILDQAARMSERKALTNGTH